MSDAPTPEHLQPGRRLGQYEIQSRLGAGGMGAVYLAHDSRLNRPVALKVLTRDYADAGAQARLVREAQAASALNHPNIVTVYEIGSEDGIDFIAMERIDGETLNRMIGRRPALRDALVIAIQIADALAAAHAAGIVHRDLKPGNVMVTGRRLVKVLDFGIAQVMPSGSPETRATVTMSRHSNVTGTLAYMSPEQAEGKDVDARSDIFSFGCVLYEMVTRHRAFQQDTEVGTLAAVVAKDPPPLSELAPDLPRGVERIIDGCLHKSRVERWQSIADVKMVLEAAVADLDLAAPPRTGRWPKGLAPALLALLILAAGAAGWQWLRPAAKPLKGSVFRRITTGHGLSAFPALSRDGQVFAYASDQGGGNLDIYVGQIGGREAIRLTTDPADESEPSFSADGAHVAFRSERDGGGIWAAPSLGGEAVLLAPLGRSPHYSPDGKWLAFWEGRESQDLLPGSAKVFLMEPGGGQPRQVATDLQAAMYPVWSPQGDSLLVLGRKAGDSKPDWWIVPANPGPSKKTGAAEAIALQGLLPSPLQGLARGIDWRDTGVLFCAGHIDSANLWEFRLPGGPATPVTQGPGYHLQVSAASGRRRLAFTHLDWRPRIMTLPLTASGRADSAAALGPLMGGDQPDAQSPSVSADGRLVAYRSLDRFLWSVRVWNSTTGKDIAVVAGLTAPYNPRISGDGSAVAYCDRPGNIFAVPAAGGGVKKLCSQCGTTMGVSADGNRITFEPLTEEDLMYYDAVRQTKVKVAVRPADTILSGGRFSPDDKWMAFHLRGRGTSARVFVVRVDGALPVPREQWIEITDGQAEELEPAWSADGQLLYYLSDRDGFRCIWARKLDPVTRRPLGEPFEAAPFHTARASLRRLPGTTGGTGLSAGPGRLVFALGELTGNIWLEDKP